MVKIGMPESGRRLTPPLPHSDLPKGRFTITGKAVCRANTEGGGKFGCGNSSVMKHWTDDSRQFPTPRWRKNRFRPSVKEGHVVDGPSVRM